MYSTLHKNLPAEWASGSHLLAPGEFSGTKRKRRIQTAWAGRIRA